MRRGSPAGAARPPTPGECLPVRTLAGCLTDVLVAGDAWPGSQAEVTVTETFGGFDAACPLKYTTNCPAPGTVKTSTLLGAPAVNVNNPCEVLQGVEVRVSWARGHAHGGAPRHGADIRCAWRERPMHRSPAAKTGRDRHAHCGLTAGRSRNLRACCAGQRVRRHHQVQGDVQVQHVRLSQAVLSPPWTWDAARRCAAGPDLRARCGRALLTQRHPMTRLCAGERTKRPHCCCSATARARARSHDHGMPPRT